MAAGSLPKKSEFRPRLPWLCFRSVILASRRQMKVRMVRRSATFYADLALQAFSGAQASTDFRLSSRCSGAGRRSGAQLDDSRFG